MSRRRSLRAVLVPLAVLGVLFIVTLGRAPGAQALESETLGNLYLQELRDIDREFLHHGDDDQPTIRGRERPNVYVAAAKPETTGGVPPHGNEIGAPNGLQCAWQRLHGAVLQWMGLLR